MVSSSQKQRTLLIDPPSLILFVQWLTQLRRYNVRISMAKLAKRPEILRQYSCYLFESIKADISNSPTTTLVINKTESQSHFLVGKLHWISINHASSR